jgi:hypothetical protein
MTLRVGERLYRVCVYKFIMAIVQRNGLVIRRVQKDIQNATLYVDIW